MKQYLIAVLLLSYSGLSFSQRKSWPVNISLFSESTAIPFTPFLNTPIHPGIQIGTEFNYKIQPNSRLFQTLDISYFYHNYLAQGIGLTTNLSYELRSNFGLAFTGLLGIGYLRTFSTADEFTFVNGRYEKQTDLGNSRLSPSLAMDVGYYFRPKSIHSPKLFVRYQLWAEYPYSPGFIPIMTHVNIHIGYHFFIPTK